MLSVANTEAKMDKYLQFFLDFLSSIGAYPYRIVQSSQTRDMILLPISRKNVRYYVWRFAAICAGLQLIKTTALLGWMAEGYWKNNEMVKLALHCLWVPSFALIFSVHFVFIAHDQEFVFLINGTVALCQKLEAGKKRVNIYFMLHSFKS